MANDPELTEQMPWVHTEDGRAVLDGLYQRTTLSRSAIIRYAFNKAFGLEGVGYIPKGKSLEDVINKHAPTLGEKDRNTRNEV